VDADMRMALRGDLPALMALLLGLVPLPPGCELSPVVFLRLPAVPRPAGEGLAALRR
jgi:hypothetical protein